MSASVSENYKETLNLPNTDFPMKANLPVLELSILEKWQQMGLYNKIQTITAGRKKFILHDGPPYANGSIHIGHALNMVLKDMVVKSRLLSGFQAAFVPGWDCHGLPIELNVEKKVGKPGEKIDAKTFREKCREYVWTQIELQRRDFIRLGALGDWDRPYLTMDPHYEADIVRSLAKIIQNGHLIKGYKPVHWCIDCGSALAEAEVEYKNKTSPAIDVCFEVVNKEALPAAFSRALDNFVKEKMPTSEPSSLPNICLVIWTTTPWTLPANEAVAVNPKQNYALVQFKDAQAQQRFIVVAAELVSTVMQRYSREQYQVLAESEGETISQLKVQHPFYDRIVPVVLGDHVTLDTGTGVVHTAPAHGLEDYQMGLKYKLPIENPVGSNGCYVPSTPLLAGESVFKANEKIITLLQEQGKLLHQEKLEHSYPHCWRHKSPLIFRATQQWFISMDQGKLRSQALKAIQNVDWIPGWGEARIAGMIQDRPDWCISRQRTWGVPICLLTHKETGDLHPRMTELMEKIAEKMEIQGIDAWHDLDIHELLGQDAAHYEKSKDTLDVWFDSGVSHFAVLERRPELGFPADLYLEGSDQHRGWFQSSLLTSVAMNSAAPYRQVLTHGFMIDADGHKMSKSLGNVLAPEKVVKNLGADILRLWVSGTDYRAEIAVSEEILKRSGEVYRRIRNTARFLLANLNGFDPKSDSIPVKALIELDKWIIRRALILQQEIIKAYQDCQFHLVHQKIHHFCSIELGSFYLDVIKDRQYTCKAQGLPRRSVQTALYHIIEALVRWMAPILSFTAEEIWQYIPGERESSVFFSEWYQDFPSGIDTEVSQIFTDDYWQQILAVREAVNKALEEARAAQQIGSALEANVQLYCDQTLYQQLQHLGHELRFLLITSAAQILPIEQRTAHAKQAHFPGLWINIEASSFKKCQRCWHRREDVDSNNRYPGLCARCVENVEGQGEKRLYA